MRLCFYCSTLQLPRGQNVAEEGMPKVLVGVVQAEVP